VGVVEHSEMMLPLLFLISELLVAASRRATLTVRFLSQGRQRALIVAAGCGMFQIRRAR
jgi:hypothetical protein